ncbi:hypothetical protein AAC387_Pa12g0858 [Persea americana]
MAMALAAFSSSEIAVPIVLSNGEREIDAGIIAFNPSIGFEKLRSLIAEHIGADHHHIAIFLSFRKAPRSPETGCRVLIQNNSDVAAISRERNCFFFVLWKPSPPPQAAKRERRRGPRRTFEDVGVLTPTILRRDTPPPIDQRLGLGFVDYESRIRELQMHGENNRYPLYTNPYPSDRTSADTGSNTGMNTAVCEQCLSKERPIPFHHCVNDRVVVGFRTRFGPIERPSSSKK